jgi:stalled ribosome rescue protein Dom34
MKIDTCKLQSGHEGSVDITITAQSDYNILGSIVRPGDQIETTIRTKDKTKSASKKVSFVTAAITVEKVVVSPEAINVIGSFRAQGMRPCGKTSVWLIDGTTFTLYKNCWRTEDLQALQKPVRSSIANSPAKSAAEARAMAEVRELLARDPELLAFGAESSFYVVDHGTVRTLVITDGALAKLPKDKQSQLVNPSGKFRGAGIIVLQPTSEFHREVQSFGSVIAILRFRFNPDNCMAD